MSKQEQNTQKNYEKFAVSRRNFLKIGAATAAVVGATAGTAMHPAMAKAATTMEFAAADGKITNSKLHPEYDYGGAKVTYVEDNEEWLGTTQIVGTVKPISEAEAGFGKAKRGLLGEDALRGVTNFVNKFPISNGIVATRALISTTEAVEGTGPVSYTHLHSGSENYCSLKAIRVGTHEANPTMIECTDCQSFEYRG